MKQLYNYEILMFILSLSIMSTVALGANISISAMPPPDMISPKNLSVSSTLLSLITGTAIRVISSPGENMIGIALSWVVSLKSAMAK